VGYDITTDNWGNVYTIGSFELSADFDPGPGVVTLNAGPYCDIFISKLNATGDFVWAKNFGGFNYCIGNSIAIDALGNVHATGSFSDTVDFDPGAGVFNLIAPRSNQFVASDPDIFILKLDSTGNFIWAQNFGATSEDVGQAISVDANGNVFTTGYFEDAVDFEWGNGTFNLTTSIFEDVFVLKSDAAGNFLWAKQIVSSSFYDAGNGIATDVAGNVYITGSFAGTADLDPGIDSAFVTAASSSPDIYILKLDAGGNFLWGGRAGDIGNDAGEEIVTDASGNIFTAGSFSRTADFDFNTGVNNLTTVNTLSNVYVLKMNQNNVGIYENMIQNKFTVYPNPATNILKINNLKFEIGSAIKIFDVMGKEVLHTVVGGAETAINVSKLESGIYFVHLFSVSAPEENILTEKIIIH